MPEKTIREMSKAERRHYSLAYRVFRASATSSLALGLSALLLGLGLYLVMLERQYVNEAYYLSKSAVSILNEVADARTYAERVMEIYRGMSEEERAEVGTDAYLARFSAITLEKEYQSMLRLFTTFRLSSDINDIYLAVYDQETEALIYVADPDTVQETACPIGTWEEADEKELRLFMNGTSKSRPSYVSKTDRYGWICTSGVPIGAKKGDTRLYVLADVALTDVIKGMQQFTMYFGGAMLLLTLVLAFLMSNHMQRTLVQPINQIAEAAMAYVADRKKGIRETGHFSGLNIRTGDEVENLSFVMSDMERDIGEYEEHLTEVTAEKERIDEELSLATRIQTDTLPTGYPPFPERDEFDLFALMDPAKEVGGDFYDYFFVDEDHLALTIADVSGKGVPGALFMMISKLMIQNYAMLTLSPALVLEEVNNQLCKNNKEEMFVTAWLGILELSTGKLRAANAGHEYPVIRRAGGSFETYRDRHGFVLGGMEGMHYKDYELTLEPGDWFFTYTDGVPEATNANLELYGSERLLAELNREEPENARELVEGIVRAVESFAGNADQFDDITMLALKYLGQTKKEKVTTMVTEAAVSRIDEITEYINGVLEEAGCPLKAQMQVDVAVDEIMANISHYAYGEGTGTVSVRITVPEEGGQAEITFIDQGIPFDPLKQKEPDVTLSAEERQIGGLGIFLVRKTMDDVRYEYKGGSNVLTIVKKW